MPAVAGVRRVPTLAVVAPQMVKEQWMQSASRMKTASQRTIVAEPGLRMAWLVPALGSGHRGLRWKRRASPTAAVRPTS